MLTRCLLLLACLAASTAHAATGLYVPERLTAGSADQLLGTLDPTGTHLFYVSNENSTTQLFGEDIQLRVPKLLLDEAADVSWPRVSPDGKKLLYISYQTDAAGTLCLRDVSGISVGDRQCLPQEGRTVLQAIWQPDGSHILMVIREGLAGDIELRRIATTGGASEVVIKRDLSSPAVTPDGKWLAFVPIARSTAAAGAGFTGQAGTALEFLRLDDPKARPIATAFDLPGKSGFPAFSADGRFLYFSQYLNDTNFDGVIDGNDHSVLFRAPFDGARDQPLDPKGVEQLTSADRDCQYPFPSKERLITTCLFQGSLDVYSLPLTGSVPPDWNRAKLLDELSASTSSWEKLLLLSRQASLEKDPGEGAAILNRVIELHLNLGEYESATFYTLALERLASGRADARWREEEGIAQVLRELSGHRRAEQALSRGRLSAEFLTEERSRIARLQQLHNSTLPPVIALSALALSEVDDTIGDKGEALAQLDSVLVDANTRPIVLHALADRAEELYGELGEHDHLIAAYLKLSQHPALTEQERLAYAQALVAEIVRGRSAADRAAQLEAWRTKVDPTSEVAFTVELERALSTLTRDQQEPVRARVFDLYKQNKSFDRRRTLVHSTLERAAATDSEMLRYDFANTWVSFVDREQAERKRAEELYRDVVMERAYVEWAQANVGDARGHFFGVTLQMPNLESHIGFIEARFREGKTDVEAEYRKRFAGKTDDPVLRFALAYLVARNLPAETNLELHEKHVTAALADLEGAARGMPNSLEINHLWGYLAHQRFLRTGDRLTALEANAHYLLALDLARENQRYQAAILSALTQLQARVGNYQLALGFFEERQKLPFTEPTAQLGHCLSWAKSLLHAEQEKAAAARADTCVAQIDSTSALAKYLPLALDRAALYHLVAGDSAGAKKLYERLQPLLEQNKSSGPDDLRNRFVAHMGRAAAALGLQRPDETLSELTEAEKLLHGGAEPLHSAFDGPQPPPGSLTPLQARLDYDLLFSGLRAEALFLKGDFAGATAQMERRKQIFTARLENKVDDDRLQLALVESHLAKYAYHRGALDEALAHVEAGLQWADEFSQHTGTEVHPVGLALLRAYAELHLDGKLPLERLKLDLPQRLGHMYGLLCDRPNPDWAEVRNRYSVYLDELKLEGVLTRLE